MWFIVLQQSSIRFLDFSSIKVVQTTVAEQFLQTN